MTAVVATEKQVVGLSGARIEGVGLVLDDDLSRESWAQIGLNLFALEGLMPWLIGDWWLHGEHHYGDRADQAVALGRTPEYLSNVAWVCQAVPPNRRRDPSELSFTHHREVAKLRASDQTRFLTKAIKERWNIKELRQAVLDFTSIQAGSSASSTNGSGRIVTFLDWLHNELACRADALMDDLSAGDVGEDSFDAVRVDGHYTLTLRVEKVGDGD